MIIQKLDECFGIWKNKFNTYIKRTNVDDIFKEYLFRKSHVILFSCSKQGKTSLRKNHLHDSQYVFIQCSNDLSFGDINKKIIEDAKIKIIERSKKEKTTKLGLFFQKIFSFGVDRSTTETFEIINPKFDYENLNDIISAVKKTAYNKYVFLEDFHYLSDEVQKKVIFSLKGHYDDTTVSFIISGVWLEKNKLININPDLIGRVELINVDIWESKDLENLISQGTKKLNIEFHEDIVDSILDLSFGSVFIVQKLCYEICKSENVKIFKTYVAPFDNEYTYSIDDETGKKVRRKTETRYEINTSMVDVEEIAKIISKSGLDYTNMFLTEKKKEIKEIYYLLSHILDTKPYLLVQGIKIHEFKEKIEVKYGIKLDPNSLHKSLNLLIQTQIENKFPSLVFEYDHSSFKINITDKLFLLWLTFTDVSYLKSLLQITSR